MRRFLIFTVLWITALPAFACVIGQGGGGCGNMGGPTPWWAIPLIWIVQNPQLPNALFFASLFTAAISGTRLIRGSKEERTKPLKVIFLVTATITIIGLLIGALFFASL